jgi:hypothetical protein
MATMPDLDRLKSQLLTSGLQQKDFPLYQVIDQLIQAVRQTIDTIDDALGISGSTPGSAFGQSFATIANEKTTLPSSRRLVAGPGISFNDNFNNLVISGAPIPGSDGIEGEEGPMGMIGPQGPRGATGAAGSGSGSSMPYWFNENEEGIESPYPLLALNNANMIPETAIIDGTILARVAANETISGGWIFTGINRINNNDPQLLWNELDGPVDEKFYRWIGGGGDFFLQTVDDALSAGVNVVQVTRTGNVPNLFNIVCGLSLSGRSAVNIVADQTAWNPTGLGSVFLIEANPSAAWNIRGMVAQTNGTIVCIHNLTGNALVFVNEDPTAIAANRFNMTTVAMATYQCFTFIYNTTVSRWLRIA